MGAPHRCTHPGCTKQFDRKYNLKCHLRIHSDEKPYRCTHSHCTRRFRWKSSLNHHLLSLDHTSKKERLERLKRRRQTRAAQPTPNQHPPPARPRSPPPQQLPQPHTQQSRSPTVSSTPPTTPCIFLPTNHALEHPDGTALCFDLSACRSDGFASPVGVLPSPTDVIVDPVRTLPQAPKVHPAPLLSVFDDAAMAAPQLDALYQSLLF
ncbi:hypothetical protein BWQ96_08562 [Gracilariopsis chorda]|uniref:C2H2-type domain-containing protein n=1 Tax=Gracilariopsis chorda TaxID=448386 RepID=A0A2V3IHZ9_9FLOR|nr:hypothetical protein BWQ96_08562 [Gracilariopsis chorda]|eukprot:PXF41716.1 hypothetical protein BWQ96_08562 [Gracilariopsis chorda]